MPKTSCFYVIELVEGKIKLGQTKSWEGRLQQYTHGGIIEPVRFEIFPCPEIFLRDAERLLMDLTARWTIHGEWRFCDFEDVASIARDIHSEIEAGHFELPLASSSQLANSIGKKRKPMQDAKRYRGRIGNVITAFEVGGRRK